MLSPLNMYIYVHWNGQLVEFIKVKVQFWIWAKNIDKPGM